MTKLFHASNQIFNQPPTPDHRVLVVDDDPVNRSILMTILGNTGFLCHEAWEGAQVPPLAREFKPELILLDILLPDRDGFSVCQELKTEAATRDIPVIFITGVTDDRSKIHGLSIGGVDYITKPFNSEEVLARVRVHINLQWANRLIIESQKGKLQQLKNAHQRFFTDPRRIPEAQCGVFFEPAQETGGDQYDIVKLSQGIYGYLIADVGGHGIEASYLSSVVKALFRENASIMHHPEHTFQRINTIMKDFLGAGQIITAAYLLLNRFLQTATLISAGHLPIILCHPDGTTGRMSAEGDILGTFEAPVFKTTVLTVPKKTRFCLYSDGVTEDFDQKIGWKAGAAALETQFSKTHTLNIHEAAAYLGRNLFSAHPGLDDRLLLLCEM